MSGHSKLTPSAAHRWMVCPGSVRLCEGLEETRSEYAAEGSAAHHLAELILRDPELMGSFLGETIDGFFIDLEMLKAVSLYVNFVRDTFGDDFQIEQSLDMRPLIPGMWGTGDVTSWHEAQRKVSICDFKYGHVSVEVEENPQLLSYALGVALRYHNRGVEKVEIFIVQPRAPHPDGPIRRYEIDVVDLYGFCIALQACAEAAEAADAPLHAGGHCRFCGAAGFCPELRNRVYDAVGAMRMDGKIVSMADPKKYEPEELTKALDNRSMILDWLNALGSFAHAEAMRGRTPPGWKLIAKRSTRQWKDENGTVSALRIVGLPEEDIFDISVRSPAQIEERIDLDVGFLVERVSSGTRLVPASDPHPAVSLSEGSGFTDRTRGESDA